MSPTPIRSATAGDLQALQDLMPDPGAGAAQPGLADALLDGCVHLFVADNRLQGCAVLDLPHAQLSAIFVAPKQRREGIGRALLVALERRAVQFGLASLRAAVELAPAPFWAACGYEAASADSTVLRNLARRQTRYGARISELIGQLGIARDYGQRHRLPLQSEASQLWGIGTDAIGREHFLVPAAARAWRGMVQSAQDDGVELQVASGFRSVDYQAGIIQRKLQAGQDMARILRVSAAPGFSEHHTGRAVDVTTTGTRPLEEEFEHTPAYAWLAAHAGGHGFRLSYPRHNRHGIAFEPWHWCYSGR
jgi:D-alanyl-D-alanine carboxypeptidase